MSSKTIQNLKLNMYINDHWIIPSKLVWLKYPLIYFTNMHNKTLAKFFQSVCLSRNNSIFHKINAPHEWFENADRKI